MATDQNRELVELRRELAWLKKQIRDNERIWAGFRQIEFRLIAAASLAEIVPVLTRDFPAVFSHIDCVTLACIDPAHELTRLLDAATAPGFVPIAGEVLAPLFAPPFKPFLGPCPDGLREQLFPAFSGMIGSVALAPLLLRGRLIGSLNQASHSSTHFHVDAATDLLEHLAAVTSLSLENALNQERLKQDGLTDALTGIANRRFFERRITEEVERWSRHRAPLVCMLIDIDHFKGVNDRYGHQAGDQVLQQIAHTLGRNLRASDVLARYGGEEFVLLLPETPPTQAALIAARLCKDVRELAFALPGQRALQLSVSIGFACLDGAVERDAVSGERLIERADAALYQAKEAGRDRVVQAR